MKLTPGQRDEIARSDTVSDAWKAGYAEGRRAALAAPDEGRPVTLPEDMADIDEALDAYCEVAFVQGRRPVASNELVAARDAVDAAILRHVPAAPASPEPRPRCDDHPQENGSLRAPPLSTSIEAWPLDMVLERLADAADHLRGDHNCDAHGHEGLLYATQAAREHVNRLRAASPEPRPELPIHFAPPGRRTQRFPCGELGGVFSLTRGGVTCEQCLRASPEPEGGRCPDCLHTRAHGQGCPEPGCMCPREVWRPASPPSPAPGACPGCGADGVKTICDPCCKVDKYGPPAPSPAPRIEVDSALPQGVAEFRDASGAAVGRIVNLAPAPPPAAPPAKGGET